MEMILRLQETKGYAQAIDIPSELSVTKTSDILSKTITSDLIKIPRGQEILPSKMNNRIGQRDAIRYLRYLLHNNR